MALEQEVKLDAPVPGMSLTAEPKGRPWRRPYQYSTVDEAATYYMDLMLDPRFTDGLVEQVEVGFPLSMIADVWISASTMEGLHSVDLGALVSPVVITMMKTLLDAEGVSYEIGDEEDEVTMSKKEMIKLRDELLGSDDLESSEMPMVEEAPMEEPTEEPAPRGLMSRKQ
jgi:hypothetical protein